MILSLLERIFDATSQYIPKNFYLSEILIYFFTTGIFPICLILVMFE